MVEGRSGDIREGITSYVGKHAAGIRTPGRHSLDAGLHFVVQEGLLPRALFSEPRSGYYLRSECAN